MLLSLAPRSHNATWRSVEPVQSKLRDASWQSDSKTLSEVCNRAYEYSISFCEIPLDGANRRVEADSAPNPRAILATNLAFQLGTSLEVPAPNSVIPSSRVSSHGLNTIKQRSRHFARMST